MLATAAMFLQSCGAQALSRVTRSRFGVKPPLAHSSVLNREYYGGLIFFLEGRSSRSSAASDDSLGQLSPIDLDLGFNDLTGSSSKTPTLSDDSPANDETKTELSNSVSVSISSDPSTHESAPPSVNYEHGDGNGLLRINSNTKSAASQPRLRISLRRGKHLGSKKGSVKESKQNVNQNNNSLADLPNVRPKPRTLSGSRRAKRLLVSAKDGFISNITPGQSRKKLPTPVSMNLFKNFEKLCSSDGRVVRASTSGAVDASLIPSPVKSMTVKLIITAAVLDP